MIEMPRFAGLEKNRTQAEREYFVRTLAEAGFDPVAVGAIIEIESAKTWSPSVHGPAGTFSDPPGYPIGLIQFAPSTARSLGTTTAELERMSFEQQVGYVVEYYRKYGGASAFKRPGDYYLAGWGASPQTPDDTVLAKEGSTKYTKNPALDLNKDGVIYASELRDLVNRWIANGRSRGVWQIETSQATTIPVIVVDPTGKQIGTASLSETVAPGVTALAAIYPRPVLVAYPNGWRFVVFAEGVSIPAVSNLPYAPGTAPAPAEFEPKHAAMLLGIAAVLGGAWYWFRKGRKRHARR